MRQTFKYEVAIPLEKLYYKAKVMSNQKPLILDLVPKDPALLNELCGDLSDSGIILFLQNHKMPHQSWLVLNKNALLAVVNGSLFAPSSFPEYVGEYGSNTGVVCFSKLKKIFPQYDPNMMFGFLCHMEFCREIQDKTVVRMLNFGELDDLDKYYFFPNVVKVERPEKEWTHLMKPDTECYHFGWIMECTNGRFSADFVQLLLLRLMFGSTKIQRLAYAPLDLHTMSTVWKSGIVWSNEEGTDTLVDVIEHSKVPVRMQCKRSLKEKVFCLQHRSSLLNVIRLIKQETSCAVQTNELFIEPQYIHHPLKADYNQLLVAMDEVLKSVSKNLDYVISNCRHRVGIREILLFDPFVDLCNTLSHSIQSAELSQQTPSSEFITALANHLHLHFELFTVVISPSPAILNEIKQQESSTERFKMLLKTALKRYGNNFDSLKKMFNRMTIFQVDSESLGQFKSTGCLLVMTL